MIQGQADTTHMLRDMAAIVVFLHFVNNVEDGENDDDHQFFVFKGCGERNEASRILGGEETNVNEFPWVARLTYFNKFYCGGMVINDRYVLTAAHCVKGLMWFMIKVTLGEHNRCNETHRPETRYVIEVIAHNFTYVTFKDDINECERVPVGGTTHLLQQVLLRRLMWFMIKVTLGEHNRCNETHRPETRYVIEVIAHNFTYVTFKDDIALLRLSDRVTITDTIKPVCLPHNDENTYVGVKAIAVGWGSVGEQKNHSCYLLDVELPVLSNEECRNTKYETSMIADSMLCAGFPDKGQKDTCQGDSGGPLSAERGDKRYELLGVVSWGIGCGRAGYPGVYTRVTKYLYWIKHNARQGCFCAD
ncbi:Trypsin-3 [Papilio xuthus]|uniref:Vitamin K-dependent protein C n=1 Tax=Papilio xuthus TaxID=66420 RepID=A0A194Q4Q1_PAPXU|nr:Trypsin-3 [Papilio xuthus]